VPHPQKRKRRTGGGQPAAAAWSFLPEVEASADAALSELDTAARETDGAAGAAVQRDHSIPVLHPGAEVLSGEWDAEGVYFYQAFNHEIADWAVEHQGFGGPAFNPARMTWIKPSFAWVLYRSGYGHKHSQHRILKVKLPHSAVASLLSQCACKHAGGGTLGRVQWDPARDLMEADGREPRRCRGRAIQIGLKGRLSELYVRSATSIEDVTELSHRVGEAHQDTTKRAIEALKPELPHERPYMPSCSEFDLARLRLLPGAAPAQRPCGRGKH